MNNDDLIKYNLSHISDIDRDIKKNIKEKNDFIKHHAKRFKIYKFFTKLTNRMFQTLLILLTSLIVTLIFIDPVYSILISLNIIVFVNLIINIFINIYETKENFIEEVCKYRREYNELIIKRNSYVNMYNYLKYGDESLLNNIKLKINKEDFYQYELGISKFDNEKDSYEYKTLSLMKEKEENIKKNLIDRVNYEMKTNNKTENLTDDELRLIALSLN